MVLLWMLGLHKYLQFITFWSKSKRGELLSVERQGGENNISFTQCLRDIKSGKIYFSLVSFVGGVGKKRRCW